MEVSPTSSYEERSSWLDRPLLSLLTLNREMVLFAIILVAALFSRFYILSARVMSHDETSHVYFSWLLYQGKGYQHDPVTHGPFQFHIVALSYFLLGDNDFSARVPAALFSVATILFIWKYRRYLGRAGALIAALLFTISPYMDFYGRYVRNEAFVAFSGVVMLWAMLEYFETGAKRYLYFITAALVFHFITKETAYIYTAQALLFAGFYFIYRVTQKPWPNPNARTPFIYALIVAILLISGAAGFRVLSRQESLSSTETAVPASPGQTLPASAAGALPSGLTLILGGLAVLALIVATYFLIKGYTLPLIRSERSFDLLMLIGTIVLPLLSAFPLNFIHWSVPTSAALVNAMTTLDMVHMGLVLGITIILAVVFGLWWNPRHWLGNAGLFYAVFTILYTTIFTNGAGLFTGLLGSLGYWLAQQAVNRGSQPWYYYAFVQIPVYEYLAASGTILAVVFYLMGKRATVHETEPESGQLVTSADKARPVQISGEEPDHERADITTDDDPAVPQRESPPILGLLFFWAASSLVAFSVAGEKMPWLTVHIVLPMLLISGWSLGYLVEHIDWNSLKVPRGWLVIVLLFVFLASLAASLSSFLGTNPPFQGKTLDQLQATSTFLTGFLALLASGLGLVYLLKSWEFGETMRVFTLVIFALSGVFTARAAILANYINYDYATELLVYAHCGPGIKEALNQIQELSLRTTNGLAMTVAYDNETTYPYWWYLRNYTDQRYYGNNPTRDLRNVPAILVGEANYGKIEPIVGQAYYKFEYIRMWWPNQSYFNLSWDRIWSALKDPEMRDAVFQIWLNHDYRKFGTLTNQNLTLPNWDPAQHFRLYLRKDLVAQIWSYGSSPAAETTVADPYEGKQIKINADQIIGTAGTAPGQFTSPRNMALAPDGSIYVADSGNHRIQHLSAKGDIINVWGSFGKIEGTTAPPAGQFDEPWGIAVGPDGSVYVSDTWNHRIQKFSAKGDFIKMWGTFGQAETPFALWGPRAIAVDKQGHVLVADTGNKRIVIYDSDGNYITQFGKEGFSPGEFNEPVGVAVDGEGKVYVTDTWNQRVQVFVPGPNNEYTPLTNWEIVGWYGQSLDNKPFIAVDGQGHVFVTDPEGYRVLEFSQQGQFLRFWGDYGTGPDGFSLPNGIITDPQGGVWVADSGNNRIMHFTLPAQ